MGGNYTENYRDKSVLVLCKQARDKHCLSQGGFAHLALEGQHPQPMKFQGPNIMEARNYIQCSQNKITKIKSIHI